MNRGLRRRVIDGGGLSEGVMANERTMDWDDPTARARLIEDVGPGEYKRRFEEHCRESTVLVSKTP